MPRSRSRQTYTHYLPCGDHVGRRAEQRARTAWFHSRGLATTTYFNPMICTDYAGAYEEAVERGALTETAAGDPYVYHYSTDSQFLVSQFDFSSAAGRGMFGELLGEAVADGYDGWMEDFGEYTPLDSRSANGMDGTEMHNLYPVQYHCAAQDFARQRRPAARPLHPLRLHRGGAVRADRLGRRPDRRLGLRRACLGGHERPDHGPVGNQHLGLRHRRLLRARRQPAHPRAAPALGPVRRRLRRHADPGERDRAPRQGPSADLGRRPDRQLAPLREAAHPPLSVHRRRRGHLPAQRAADHASPRPRLPRRPPGSLPATTSSCSGPTCSRPRSSSREHASAASTCRAAAGSTSGARPPTGSGAAGCGCASRDLAGGRQATIPAPLDELPLLVRAGTVLPLLPPDVDTLAAYGGGSEDLVGLRERADRIDLLAFPRGRSAARFYGDGRIASIERRDRWTLRIREPEAAPTPPGHIATLKRPFRPCRVLLGGRRLPAGSWDYRAGERVLDRVFRGARAKLTVLGGPWAAAG